MVVAFFLCCKCWMVVLVAFVLHYKCWLVVAFVLCCKCWMVVAFVLQLGFGVGVSGHSQCLSSTSRETESLLQCLCLQKHTVLASDLAFSVLCMPQFPHCAWISNKTPVPILFHHKTLPRFMGGGTSGCVAYKGAARVQEGGYCWLICMQTLAVFLHTNSQPCTLAYDW